ncbi:hypothetical protein O6H91_18G076900 [Diphasiastrum complanatum]|uniref:Uncharacterized protein n=4 Tax=Diphasiastrum complanatum TaxID=34168 RepID=A0ACC2B2Q8_DIPCM|nr:hypothetical protein O6H91_18G076900 [Diphasiastrum complanatum]KAJ7524083.1 hypothetical protein O6H91_18G076900 [Diphasiastrum complanatum]KAJ7524084.1 hypothetical protein O6H91_18G076900 [Diphasiastrum complanatum]KAJ7524085.1 hypothetical protein O6H91_18G076900 [Diphasiastrum complanatum]
MASEPKIKSTKEVLAENLTELIDRNPSIAALILLSVILIAWSIQDFLSPAIRFACLVLAPQIWRGAVQWLTQPVLFFLVNLVIVSIMISSGSVSWTSNELKEVNCIEKYRVHSEQSSSTVVRSSRSPSLPDKNMHKVWPTPPIPVRLESDNEWQFSSRKRSFLFSHSYNTSELLPRGSLSTIFPTKQLGAPLSPPESTDETQSEQTFETTKPSSSYARQSDQQRGSMDCMFQPDQPSEFAEADTSGRGSNLDAKRAERRNSALQKGSSEHAKKTTWKSYSDDEKPSKRSYCEHERSTRNSFSETSEADTDVQTGQGYVLRSSSAKGSAYVGAPSSVIVRDVSVDTDNVETSAQSVRDPLVIDLEELNERIQALYTKHREQARQDSLRRN